MQWIGKILWWTLLAIAAILCLTSGLFNLIEEDRTGQLVRWVLFGSGLLMGLLAAGKALRQEPLLEMINKLTERLGSLGVKLEAQDQALLEAAIRNQALLGQLGCCLESLVKDWNDMRGEGAPSLEVKDGQAVWIDGTQCGQVVPINVTTVKWMREGNPQLLRIDVLEPVPSSGSRP